MTKLNTLSLSLILSLGLAACGGGGGDTTPVVANPGAAYVPGAAELGAWDVLSKARTLCGFDGSDPLVKLSRNAKLDAAALSHSKYQVDLSISTGVVDISHWETPGVPGFTGVAPWDRAVYQGYDYLALAEILAATSWDYSQLPSFPTMEERGASSMRSLLNTVYHLSGAMYEGADVGLGAYMQTTMINATTSREIYHFGSLNGYQSLSRRITLGSGTLATYPCQGSINIPTKFEPAKEIPNPLPTMTIVGPPIYLKVDAGQLLKLTSRSVSQNGASVPTILLTDTDPYIDSNEAFVIPTVALMPNTTYTVSLAGTINGVPFSLNFAMSTGLDDI